MAYDVSHALKQIMDVYRLVLMSRFTRNEAINEVAMKLRIDPQTVRSSCTRSIGLKTREFESFLLPEHTDSFEDYLIKRFPGFQDVIENFFNNIQERNIVGKKNDPIRMLKSLFPEEQRNLLKTVLLDEMQGNIIEWVDRDDVPDDIKQHLNKWINMIKKV